jgi:predicted alpha/beta-fold hydrolase
MATASAPYRAPWWLPGGHLQTIYPALLFKRARVDYRRERWNTPDGDFIDVDFLDGERGKPLVVLFHGLEGSSGSHYALALMTHLKRLGWSGAIPHFRGCSGELNLMPRFYHSGDAQEIDWIVRRMAAMRNAAGEGDAGLFTAGASLGGNALLRWLGESGDSANFVDAACAVSAPLDLTAGGAALSRGFNLIYTRSFLETLKPKCLKKLEQFPDLYDGAAMMRARDLYQFDNVVTAPLHGYRDVDDYWNRASAKHVLDAIKVPTLVLNARNDPFLPAHALPASASECVTLEFPETGGHVGFVTGAPPGNIDWLPRRLLAFMQEHRLHQADRSVAEAA